MAKTKSPRHGSMMYAPRVRAKRIYPRVSSKNLTNEAIPSEFAGYKVGMTHVKVIDDVKNSATHNQEILIPVTVIEVPAVKVVGIKAYSKTPYGLKGEGEVRAEKHEKELIRKLKITTKKRNVSKEVETLEKGIENFEKVVVVVQTQPVKAGIDKKRPEVFEMDIGGTVSEAFAYAKENLGKELNASDILKSGSYVDAVAITKGHGFQGSIKRFGVRLLPKKSQKLRRKAANLGGFHPHKVKRTVPQMGQTGYHKRTDYNKRIISIANDVSNINKDGWNNYGLIKSPYVLIKGSVPGAKKRLIRIRNAIRLNQKDVSEPEVIAMHIK